MTDRLADTVRFYGLLGELEARVGGARVLTDCNGYMNWPERGGIFSRKSAKHGTDRKVAPGLRG